MKKAARRITVKKMAATRKDALWRTTEEKIAKKGTNIGKSAENEALAETTEEHTDANERTPLIPRLARRMEGMEGSW